MSYYAIAQFNSQKEAEAFAFAQKKTQIEVITKKVQDNKQLYADIDVTIDKLVQDEKLTDEQAAQINKEKIIDNFYYAFDFTPYDAFIKEQIKEQINNS